MSGCRSAVNAGGATYEPDADAWPNFVFYDELRPFAAEYYAWLGAQLANETAGGRVAGLRLGGGHYGELSYPRNGPAGGVYWAFGPRAKAKNPVPWWVPGTPAPNGEALTFLTWYLGAMADYQDWQAAVAGAAFPGVPLAMLYPGGEVRRGLYEGGRSSGKLPNTWSLPSHCCLTTQATLAELAVAVAAGLPQTSWNPITAGQVRGGASPRAQERAEAAAQPHLV